MSTIHRRQRAARSLGPYKRHELLTGEIRYSAIPDYTGYSDGVGTDLTAFIGDEMRRDWESHRDELMSFWRSGKTTTRDVFPDSVPWLHASGRPGAVPWAALHLGKVVTS
jgi:hypothetical protein